MSAETIEQALTRLGYTCHRVECDGALQGMEIKLNGERVHRTPYASADLAIEIIESNGGFRTEEELNQ